VGLPSASPGSAGGDEGAVADPEAQAQVGGAGDADAWAGRDAEIAGAVGGLDREEAAGEIVAVFSQGDGERASEVAGSAGESCRGRADAAPARHRRQPGDRLQRADQHASRSPRRSGDRVQAVVNSVVQIDIGEAAVTVEERAAAGPE